MVRVGPVQFWYEAQPGILVATFDEDAELDIEDARGRTRGMIEVSKGKPAPLLVELTGLKSQTKRCRDYFATDPSHIRTYSTVAILVTSPLARIVANFFLGINKPVRPTGLFEDQTLAVEWLEGHVDTAST